MQSPQEAVSSSQEHHLPTGLGPDAALSPSGSSLHKATLAAAALVCAAYVIYFAQLTSLPLQDFPNHLARARIIDDLLFNGGARFGSQFAVQRRRTPVRQGALFVI
jgi:hypothetical protein